MRSTVATGTCFDREAWRMIGLAHGMRHLFRCTCRCALCSTFHPPCTTPSPASHSYCPHTPRTDMPHSGIDLYQHQYFASKACGTALHLLSSKGMKQCGTSTCNGMSPCIECSAMHCAHGGRRVHCSVYNAAAVGHPPQARICVDVPLLG